MWVLLPKLLEIYWFYLPLSHFHLPIHFIAWYCGVLFANTPQSWWFDSSPVLQVPPFTRQSTDWELELTRKWTSYTFLWRNWERGLRLLWLASLGYLMWISFTFLQGYVVCWQAAAYNAIHVQLEVKILTLNNVSVTLELLLHKAVPGKINVWSHCTIRTYTLPYSHQNFYCYHVF